MAGDSFSEWHRCDRWTKRGLECPFDPLEGEKKDRERDPKGEGEASANSGAIALYKAVGGDIGITGTSAMELLGPLLGLFTVLRAVQTLGPGLKMGRVQAAGLAEEATVRVLRP